MFIIIFFDTDKPYVPIFGCRKRQQRHAVYANLDDLSSLPSSTTNVMPPSSNMSINSSDFDCFDVPIMDEEGPSVVKKKMMRETNYNNDNNSRRQQHNIMQQSRPTVLADRTNFQNNYQQPSSSFNNNNTYAHQHRQHTNDNNNNNNSNTSFNNNNSFSNNYQPQQQQQPHQQQRRPVSYQQKGMSYAPLMHEEEKRSIAKNYPHSNNRFHDRPSSVNNNLVSKLGPSNNNSREKNWNNEKRNQGNDNRNLLHHSKR